MKAEAVLFDRGPRYAWMMTTAAAAFASLAFVSHAQQVLVMLIPLAVHAAVQAVMTRDTDPLT